MPLLRVHAKFCLGIHLKFTMKGLKFFFHANFLSFLVGMFLSLFALVATDLLVFKFK